MSQNTTQKERPALPDEEIIDLYWKRDERAIEETDVKYRKFLYTVAHNIIHDKMDAEECLNDTYLGTWNRIPPAKPNPFRTFLTKIMRNIAVDRYRKNNADKRISSEMTVSLDELDECVPSSPSAEEEYLIQELARLLNKFIRSLEERQEFVFVCRYYFADKIETIANMLKTSPRTVYRQLAEIRNDLKELLEKEGFGNEEV